MAVYLVTWDLNREKPNYAAARNLLIDQIQTFENIKDSGLDSVLFISTTWTANQVYDDLAPKLDKDDRVVVTKMSGADHQGWLSQATWDWINSRL